MISLEEKFLVNILYRPASEILNGVDITNINFEKLITLASGHLMLPALFFNIQKKKASYLFPEDFIAYIKNIFTINKARNEILLAEAKQLSQLLVENNINHIFLKGTALLLSNVFEDIGERMIGDIDFIIQHKDEGKIKEVLEKHNYRGKNPDKSFKIFRHRHLAKATHKNKIIGIEPHLKLLNARYKCAFNSKKLLSTFNEGVKTNKTPSTSFLFDHCIYNFQINDKGFINAKHSHRSIYDIYKLSCKKALTIKNCTKDIYVKHFFLTIAKFNIFDILIISSFWCLYYDTFLRFLTISFIIITTIDSKFKKINKLFYDKTYRKRVSNKVSVHYHSKTVLRWLNILLKSG